MTVNSAIWSITRQYGIINELLKIKIAEINTSFSNHCGSVFGRKRFDWSIYSHKA